jgi:hypothetical protein
MQGFISVNFTSLIINCQAKVKVKWYVLCWQLCILIAKTEVWQEFSMQWITQIFVYIKQMPLSSLKWN